jgi:agmatinase
MPHYEPIDALALPRFAGVRTFMRLPLVQDLEILKRDHVDFVVAGLPFDTGATFRAGARFGPEAIRSASALLRPYNPELDLSIFEHIHGVDYGDSPVAPGFIEDSYARMQQFLQPLHEAGITPIGLGGDHAVVLAELRAAAAVHGPLALVHFDSHTDTWDQYWGHQYTHGTPFRRAAEEGLLDTRRSTMTGMRGGLYGREDLQGARDLGFTVIPMTQLRQRGNAEVLQETRARAGDAKCFLSFDIDFIDPAYAPGTGTPEVGGPTSADGLELVRGLAGLNFVGFDVVEVYPQYDAGAITAELAANVAYEMISLIAWRKKKATSNEQ